MTVFQIHGPFLVGGSPGYRPTSRSGKDVSRIWRERGPGEPWQVRGTDRGDWFESQQNNSGTLRLSELREAKGVYVFTARQQENAERSALYVGMARAGKGFFQEAVGGPTLRKVAEKALNGSGIRNARLDVFFFTPMHRGGRPPTKRIQDLETFLIARFHGERRLINLRKRPDEPWDVDRFRLPWSPAGPGNLPPAVASFRDIRI